MLHEVQDRGGRGRCLTGPRQVILFIDEIHTVVGAGKGDGAMDAGNLLKPALARGQLRCIGATTLDEYRQYIEKDAALERRFQQGSWRSRRCRRPTAILRGLKERYEVHHGVTIDDSALVAAAALSDRYIPERFLPDKAIDLVDEAAAKLKMDASSRPQALDEVSRKLVQVRDAARIAPPTAPTSDAPLPSQAQMEEISLANDAARDARAAERLRLLRAESASLAAEQSALTKAWEAEKGGWRRWVG